MVVDKAYQGNSKVECLTNYALEKTRLGTDHSNRAHAVIKSKKGNPVAQLIGSTALNGYLKRVGFNHGDVIKNEDLNEVNALLTAHAEFEGEAMIIFNRIGRSSDGSIEIDIADENNTRIKLAAEKVEIITEGSETLFSRSSTTQALPVPSSTGDHNQLLPFLNMDEEEKWLFIGNITYLYAHPKEKSVGYPITVIKGEQGSGKSVLCKSILRALIEPNSIGVQVFPSDPKEMAISAQNRFLLIYDNLRGFTNFWSDFMCHIPYGAAITSRKLYSDSDEAALMLHAPLVLNGIHSFIKEPDLANRCLTIHLSPMDQNNRKLEKELASELEALLPSIFRGLLELTVKALAILDDVEIIYPQRMMGFVKWLAALEAVLELPAGKLQKAYSENQKQTMLETIQEDHLAYAVLQFAKQRSETEWSGTPAQLLKKLSGMVPTAVTRSTRTWPANAISLSKRLSALQKALSAQGVDLLLGERGKHRKIVVGMQSDD